MIYPDAHVASTWFLNILRYVDKCEEGRVTMRTVPNAIIIDDTQPRTPNQSFISLRLRRAVRPPVLSDRAKRDRRCSSWRKSFSPCLCRSVSRLKEGPEKTIVSSGGQTRDTYKDDFLDILEPDDDKQLK